MKLQFLGVGGAFSVMPNLYHSNMLITAKSGKKLLIDCGQTAAMSLNELGYHPGKLHEIDGVYISHLHADHVGSMEYFALARHFIPPISKPKLFGNKGILKDLWFKTLRGGLETLQVDDNTLTTFFEVHSVSENGHFEWEGYKFQLFQTVHIINGFSIVPSYGLIIEALYDEIGGAKVKEFNEKILITTDTQFNPNQLRDFYKLADIIFHDCETTGFSGKDGNWIDLKSGVHAHYTELRTLDVATKKKMYLYHYQNDHYMEQSKDDGFAGFVKKHQEFVFGN